MTNTVKLIDIVTIVGGGTPSKQERMYWENGTIKWATVGDMNVNRIQQTKLSITEKGLKESSSNKISKDAIIIATRVGLGKVCYLEDDTAINQDLKGLLPNKGLTTKEYLYYFLKSITNYIVENGTGATVKGVKLDFVKNIDVPLPSLLEQQRIVSKLDLLFEKIDKAIALHVKNMEEADAFMGSVLNDVFGEMEEKYDKKKLKDIVDNYDGKRVPIKSADRDSMQGEYPYYGASGIIDYVNNFIFDGEYLLISEDGANLTACIQSISATNRNRKVEVNCSKI